TYLMRTGRVPTGSVQYPTLGSVFSKELGRADAELPNFVSIAPTRFVSPAAFESGFLGPQYAPLVVGENMNFFGNQQEPHIDEGLKVEDLALADGSTKQQAEARVRLLEDMEQDFLAERAAAASLAHHTAYQRAVTLMRSTASRAFNLEEEPLALR